MGLTGILGIAFGSFLFIVIIPLIFYRRIKAAKERKNPDLVKIKCRSLNCELLIDRVKSKDYLCDFHKEIQKYHFILEENKDPERMRSRMYMQSNAAIYKSIQSFEKTINSLKIASKKYKK